MERKSEKDWVENVLTFEVEDERLRGQPRKAWMEAIKIISET